MGGVKMEGFDFLIEIPASSGVEPGLSQTPFKY